MMLNTAKHEMMKGQPAIGALAGLGSPLAAEYLSRAGFDFVMVDVQHGSWDLTPAKDAFRAISLGSAIPMARAAQNDYYAIGSLLDRGSLGIVVPMVNSAEEARAAVWAARYPPLGSRSAATPMVEHLGEDYLDQANDEIFLAVQIETAQGLEQVEEILSVEGVDGCWIGPMDLAKSLGIDQTTQEGAAKHLEAIMQVLVACHSTGKVPGIYGAGDAGPWLDRGFLFVTTGSDGLFVNEGSHRVLKGLGRPIESALQARTKRSVDSMSKFKVVIVDFGVPDMLTEAAEFEASGLDIDLLKVSASTEEDIIPHVGDADGLMVGFAPFTRRVIESMTRCRVISRYGIGYNNVDLDAATERGIVVCNVPDYCLEEVSTHTIGFLLCLNRHINYQDRHIRGGVWVAPGETAPGRLTDQVLGIVGLGNIGKLVARKAQALGLRVQVFDPYLAPETTVQLGSRTGLVGRVAADLGLYKPPLPAQRRNTSSDRRRPVGKDEAFCLLDQHGPGTGGRPASLDARSSDRHHRRRRPRCF